MTQGPYDAEKNGEQEGESGRPIVRDRRRIDPKTYQVRDPDATPASAPADQQVEQTVDQPRAEAGDTAAELEKLKAEVADRTADLQRVQAEYVNYKRRVDRDRDLARAGGIETVLRDLLGVLDSITAAREHDELTGGFKGVADEIEKLANRYGLESFGEPGDPFDPRIHEALMHAPVAPGGSASGITGPTAVTILQPGYKIKDRVIRPARVAVAEPDEDAVSDESAGPDARATEGMAEEPAGDTGTEEAVDDNGSGTADQA